jgi:YVTN family beta-propeller protein
MANLLTVSAAASVICMALGGHAAAAETAPQPLALEATIALPGTSGRIDHLDIDLGRRRLFVAELGNGSVDVVDLASRKVIRRISGLDEPQGVVFAPKADVLAIACGGDGTVRLYSGESFAPRGVIKLGDDADDARLDPQSGAIVIGYGGGGLAIIDPAKAAVVKTISLPAHPEGFQLADGRAFVNVPDAGQIDIADLASGRLIARWTPQHLSSNFPLALADTGMVATGFRSPATLALFDRARGQMVSRIASCGDADDIYFDTKRRRYYVSCGAGRIDIFALSDDALQSLGRVPTSWGARTSLFVPELDRLFLAARAGLLFGSNASIHVYRPLP